MMNTMKEWEADKQRKKKESIRDVEEKEPQQQALNNVVYKVDFTEMMDFTEHLKIFFSLDLTGTCLDIIEKVRVNEISLKEGGLCRIIESLKGYGTVFLKLELEDMEYKELKQKYSMAITSLEKQLHDMHKNKVNEAC